ncbi:hypothetical protein RchiOBHm_Chr7g0210171 [Rosa chinensis]|uniref:Uncharacterized protein n=1 Tax=Rosa chinensis TaxID=74649 RepID=A0A2P6PA53_ROSCH|nr:hypothetical protein RchiOBHm_Chr7g0210171 [Rosa chinensis]
MSLVFPFSQHLSCFSSYKSWPSCCACTIVGTCLLFLCLHSQVSLQVVPPSEHDQSPGFPG